MTKKALLTFAIRTALARSPQHVGFSMSQKDIKKIFARPLLARALRRVSRWFQEKCLGALPASEPMSVHEKLGQFCVQNGWVFVISPGLYIFYTLASAQSWDSVRAGKKTITNGSLQ